MKKRLVAKTGEYQKDNEIKGEYTEIGVELQNANGPYLLLDPAISLSGILAKQNVLAMQQNKPVRSSVMVSLFDIDQPTQGQGQNQNSNQGYQQNNNSNNNQNNQPPQNGYQNSRG
jgi:hypothetical protein